MNADLLALLLCGLTAGAARPGGQPMFKDTPLYSMSRERAPTIDAVEYPLKGEVAHIFAVPERGAVGTNSFRNAITVLDLSGPKVQYREVMRDFTDEAGGGSMVFLPASSKDYIGYAKRRVFLLLNLRTKQAQRFKVANLIEEKIEDVAVIDWDRRLFLFKVDLVQMGSRLANLVLLDLSHPEPVEVASFEIGEPFDAVLGRKSFFYSKEANGFVLHALSDGLEPTDHPLLRIMNGGILPTLPGYPVVHPTLPLAVWSALSSGPTDGVVVWSVSWKEPKRPVVMKISESASGGFQFSPDGKWLAFRDSTSGPTQLMVMPVDPALPHFLGPPILLRTAEKMPTRWNGNCAWITEPTGVVCTINRSEYISTTKEERSINKLLKWTLPGASMKK